MTLETVQACLAAARDNHLKLESELPAALQAFARTIVAGKPDYGHVAALRAQIGETTNAITGLEALANEIEAAEVKAEIDLIERSLPKLSEKIHDADAAVAAATKGSGDPDKFERRRALESEFREACLLRDEAVSRQRRLGERLRQLCAQRVAA